jgi:beta-fructofuranosidase
MASPDTDPHYPRFHFAPESGTLNDPCGVVWQGGECHLFYQRHACWGHAASSDLVHWRHLPLALEPTPGTSDEGGCWSGSAGIADGKPVILYTGVDVPPVDQARVWRQVVCLATGSDDLATWTKHPANPLVDHPPGTPDFRDPCFWKEGGDWYMLVGAGIEYQGATALLYRSADLVQWEYLHPLCTDHPDITNRCWECPDFFTLGDRHVLLTSRLSPLLAYASMDATRVMMSTFYDTGSYKDQRFTREVTGNLDAGGHFYAAKTGLDDKGRRLLFGWIWEGRPNESWQKAGWAGMISLPRLLSLANDGTMRYSPPDELQILRGNHREVAGVALSDETVALDTINGDCLELIAEFVPGTAEKFGLALRRSPDGQEQTLLTYRPREATLTVERHRSSLDPDVWTYPRGDKLPLADGEKLQLHVFLDRSVIEVFANGKLCLTSRIYPTRDDSLGIAALAHGGSVTLPRIEAWELAP